MVVQIETPVGFYMPSWTTDLLDEAGVCYTNGQYTGCILSLAAGVEHGLRELLRMNDNSVLDKLIRVGVARGVVNGDESTILQALKEYRNHATHSHIDDLAAGKALQRQKVVLTEQGMMASSVWEEFEPESQGEKEMAASLSAVDKVGDLLVKVREVLYDICDRYSALAHPQYPQS